VLSNHVQDASGVMTTLNDTVLSGAAVTKEISGDANGAQGRWVSGTITTPSSTKTLTGTDNAAFHYAVLNNLAAMPTSGSATCATGTFTAPSLTKSSGSAAITGTASGTVTVAFGTSSASITGSIDVVANGSPGTVAVNASIPGVTNVAMTGSFFSGGPGAGVMMGTDGGAGYVVVAGYIVRLANGNEYTGLASFRCS